MKTVKDFDLNNKTVVLRCDLNVPIKNNIIIDDTRIKESLKTIEYILNKNAKLIILSHLGKVTNESDKKSNTLRPVARRLNEYLNNKVEFVPFTRSNIIKDIITKLDYGKAILLENTRYEDLNGNLESKCNDELSKYWASLGDLYINDAFGTLHRGHASNQGISKYLKTGIGFLVEKELDELNKLDNPQKPFALIMGGAKISDKLKVIENLLPKVDILLIGGAMANTFIKAQGYNIGDSLFEEDYLDYCINLLKTYKDKIIIPLDVTGSYDFSNDLEVLTFNVDSIQENFRILDIGPKTVDLFINKLNNIKTIFWNGPLGVYEFSNFRKGTKEVLSYISSNVPTVILGGGDIVACAKELDYIDKITFASTGGGATLEYLEDKNLPGLKNIK